MNIFIKQFLVTFQLPNTFLYVLVYALSIILHHNFLSIYFSVPLILALLFPTFLIFKKDFRIISLVILFLLSGIHLELTNNRYKQIHDKISNKATTIKAIIYDKRKLLSNRFQHQLLVKIVSPKQLTGNFIKLLCLPQNLNIQPGESIEFTTRLTQPNNHQALLRLKREKLIAQGLISPNSYSNSTDIQYSCFQKLVNWFNYYKHTLYKKIGFKMSRVTRELFNSLFLGNNDNSKSLIKIRSDWNALGISHYLARSGLHIMLLLALWGYLILLIPCSFLKKQFLLLLIASIYYFLSWPSISFNRAFLAALLYIFCKIRHLPIHQIHLISLICLLFLMHNPYELFFLDFQLSFGITFLLAWYNQAQNSAVLMQLNSSK